MITHRYATFNGIRLHYVTAGQGEPLVLLHGYPQTHYAGHKVIPLANHFTIIAPDLRGLGDCDRPETVYDKRTVAEDVNAMCKKLIY